MDAIDCSNHLPCRFRVNDLLKTMATSKKFLQPLRQFRKRIAYANAFGTDFPVPTATAAFLHSKSTYPHYSDQDNPYRREKEECVVVDNNGLVVAIFHTPSMSETSELDGTSTDMNVTHSDDLAFMSHCLDSLGWKKVFVDLRNEIPIGLNVPRLPRSGQKSPQKKEPASHALKQRDVIGSADVAKATGSPPDRNRISFPMGHNMIVAFSRDNKAATFYKGGRPVVNALANELVELIFAWECPGQEK